MKMLAVAVLLLTTVTPTHAQKRGDTRPVVSPPPIVRVNTPKPAQVAYQAWVYEDAGDYTAAYTGNESGSRFGIMCGQSCIVYVNFQKGCDHGDDYPAMINSSAGAYSIMLRCHHVDEKRLLSTELTNDYIDMLAEGGEFGVAIPLEGGRFSVSRFSLSGGIDAVDRAVSAAVARAEASQQGLRDFTI